MHSWAPRALVKQKGYAGYTLPPETGDLSVLIKFIYSDYRLILNDLALIANEVCFKYTETLEQVAQ